MSKFEELEDLWDEYCKADSSERHYLRLKLRSTTKRRVWFRVGFNKAIVGGCIMLVEPEDDQD